MHDAVLRLLCGTLQLGGSSVSLLLRHRLDAHTIRSGEAPLREVETPRLGLKPPRAPRRRLSASDLYRPIYGAARRNR